MPNESSDPMLTTAPISVVIPAYNAEEFLSETIKSVHAQTLPVAEIVVVDDGSSDRTAAIAQGLGAVVVRQPNGGLSAARNTGIRAAGQPWIAFLDADDLWEPEKLERQWAAVRLCPEVGLVLCDTRSFADQRVVCQSFLADPKTRYELAEKIRVSADVSYFPQITENFFLARIPFFSPTVLVRRDLLLSAGLFDENLRCKEDMECFLRVLAHDPLAIVERPLMRYRLHRGSLSTDKLKMYLSSVAATEKIIANPEKYAQGAARAHEKLLPQISVRAGRLLLEQGQMRDARAMFRRGLQNNFKPRVFMLWLCTWLSPRAIKRVRRLKFQLRSSPKFAQPPANG